MKKIIFAATLVATSALTVLPVHAAVYSQDNVSKRDYEELIKDGLRALKIDDYGEALELLTKGAKMGNKLAQYYLATMYIQGQGMEEPNYEQGWLWLNVALEQTNAQWKRTFNSVDSALPEDFKTSMAPLVEEHIALYGAEAQDLQCKKRRETGSNIKNTICEKRFY